MGSAEDQARRLDGFERAAADSPAIRAGLNLVRGKVTNQAVAETFGMPCQAP